MAASVILLAACKKEKDEMKMIITAKNTNRMQFSMAGSGTVTIDWGDGTKETVAVADNSNWPGLQVYIPPEFTFRRDYSASSTYTITVTGKITHMFCSDFEMTNFDVSKNVALEWFACFNNQLTSLNVTRNTALKNLYCFDNQLTVLDIKKNTALEYLSIRNNLFRTEAINDIFRALLVNTDVAVYRRVFISGNPGTDDCDRSIAENKGWFVN